MLGVVYRGSRWLDGLIFEGLGKKRAAGVTQIIKNSPYFKELRYILIRKPTQAHLDGKRLSQGLKLPVIGFRAASGRKTSVVGWGITREAAVATLSAFTTDRGEPDGAFLVGLLKTALERLP